MAWETIPDQPEPAADPRCTATNDQGCRCDHRAGHAERVHHHAGDYWRTPEPDRCPATTTLGWVCVLPSGHEDAHRHRDDDGADFLWMTTDPDVSDLVAGNWARCKWFRDADGTIYVGIEGLLAELRQRAGHP
jgi:hypothetical protein